MSSSLLRRQARRRGIPRLLTGLRPVVLACVVMVAVAERGTAAWRPAADCPQWLRQAAAAPPGPGEVAGPAVVLVDDLSAAVSADGAVTTRRKYAARIYSHEGQDAGVLREWYLTDTGKVRQLRGWVIRPSGEVQELDKQRVLDLALASNDVYNEARVRVLSAGDVEPGTVFGAEVVSEDRSVFAQADWPLQERWGVRSVTRSLTVPVGWQVSSVTFNHAAIQPAISGTTYMWSLSDLPAIDDEPSALPNSSLTPRVAVSYAPPSPSAGLVTFSDWKSVSKWLAAISEGQALPDPAITAKAAALTAGASTDIDRIRAIAGYVQRVQYISIQIGMGRGGGYRPRPAAVVFARNHGDCKDKANLMRAMLAAVGIRSYLTSAFAGDPAYVREEWPSPLQFNHCILAIVIGSATGIAEPIVEVSGLGRLLIVDPTAEYTPVGAIPGTEQGSLALVVAPDAGTLIRLPMAADEANGYDRTVEGRLAADGGLDAEVRFRAKGDVGSFEHSAAAGLAAADYQKLYEKRLSSDIPGARVTGLDAKPGQGTFEVSMHIEAARFGQVMQSRLLVFRPPFRATDDIPALNGATRRGPADLKGIEAVEMLRLNVAAGFVVDELPQPTTIVSPFGSYSLTSREEGGHVIVERRCLLKRGLVPASDYVALRTFLNKARAADSSPIVFRRQ